MKKISLLVTSLFILLSIPFFFYRPQTIWSFLQFEYLQFTDQFNTAQAMQNPVDNIFYRESENPKHTLDIYWPEGESNGKVLIFFHGGAWQEGDKSSYPFIGRSFSEAGFFTVLPNYRLHPEVDFPEFLQDSAQAVKWVVDNIGEYGGNGEEIYLMGHSAGGHIVTMLGSDAQYLGEYRDQIKGVISIAGVHDLFRYETRRWDRVFGKFARNDDAMPINYAEDFKARLLALHGDGDNIVNPEQSPLLVDLVNNAGGQASLKTYPNLDHFKIINVLHPKFTDKAEVFSTILEWINSD